MQAATLVVVVILKKLKGSLSAPLFVAGKGLGLLLLLCSLTWAAPAVVQSNSGWAQGTAAPSVAFTSANTAGNLLWVAIGSTDTIAAPTDTRGNIYTLAASVTGSGGAGNAAIYYVPSAIAGPNTVTCQHPGSGDTHCQIAEISGLVATSPLDQTGSRTSTSDCYVWTSGGATSGGTSQLNEWVAAFFYDSSNSKVLSPGTSSIGTAYTQIQLSNNSNTGDAGLSESASASAVGLQTAGCSGNGSDVLSGLITTFKIASGDGPTVVQSDSGWTQGPAVPSVAFTRPNTAGDLLWVAIGSNDTIASPTDSLGNVYTLAASVTSSNGSGNAAIYYAASAKAGANTVTCHHPGSGDTHCHIAEISGLPATSPLDQIGSGVSANSCSVSTTGAPAQPNEWIGAFFFNGLNVPPLTAGSGYTSLQLSYDTSGVDVGLSESGLGSSGVQSASCGSSTGNVAGLITTFKTANGGVPVITSITPTKGGPDSLTSISINGMNFGASQGSSTVSIGGVTSTPQNWGPNSIGVPTPNGLVAGNANVVVNAYGVSSNAQSFLVTPYITGISPSPAPVGASVTISGAGFGTSQGSSTVTFNGTTATPTSWADNSIVTTVPAGATTGNVLVTVNGIASLFPQPFTVGSPPAISSLSATSGSVGSSVTITGSSFGSSQGTSTVTIGGATATASFWSDTSVIATVPTDAVSGSVSMLVGGISSNFVSFTVNVNITSLSPSSGALGSTVTITGTGFSPNRGRASHVTFNGTNATISSWSSTSITATVPVGATSGNVVVSELGVASNPVQFTVVPSLLITGLSPNPAPVGASVTISGTNFGATQGSSTLTFNGVAATVSSWGNSSITAVVPAGATNGNVVVTVGGVSSGGVSFTVMPPPAISSLTPNSSAVFSNIVIAATNLGPNQFADTVTFNGTPATIVEWSPTSLTAYVPSGATTGNVVVSVYGAPSNSLNFTVVPNPAITGVAPSSAAVGASVTITGTHFGATQGNGFVSLNGATPPVTSWSDTSIGITVPPDVRPGNGSVTVTAAGGQGSPIANFTVNPTITSISPTSGATGTSVTIVGTSFGQTTQTGNVTFNGTVAPATSWSNTQIVAPVPSGATSGNVVVTSLFGGVASNGVPFTVIPTISSLVPTSGITGASVTINGTGFGNSQGTSTVTFNGVAATPASWSNTQIVVPVPSAATSGNVVVTVGGNPSNGVAFSVIPAISTVSPGKGATGASVTITGTGFGASQGPSTVTFNGTSGTPTSWSNTQIVVPVPNAATSGNVVVTVGGNASNGIQFTVVPSIASLSPASGAVGTVVTVAGTGFGSSQGTSTITFNGTAATPVSWSNSAIFIQAPSGTTTGNVVVTVAGNASNGASFMLSAAPLVQSNSSSATSVTSTSVAFFSNNTAGNLLWVAVGSGGTITPPTDTQGNTYALAASTTGAGNSGNAAIYYAASAKGGANTVTCNQSSSADIHCHIAEITGLAPGARLDQIGSVGSSSTCSVSTSAATKQANEWLGAFFFDATNNRALTAGNGYATLQLSSNGVADAGLSESQSVTSSGVQTATCGGNASDSLNQLIATFGTLQPAAIGLTSSTASSTYGSPVTLTATVSGNVGTPTGTVTFNDGTTLIGSTTISAGSAIFTTNSLGAGTHSITASYGGDANYVGAQSPSVSESVAQGTASIALTSSVTGTATFGTPVTFTATVTPSVITGNMTFSDGSASLGSAPITNGQAVLTTSDLNPGSHSITASLAGTSNFIGTTSTAVTTPVSLTGVAFTLNCVNGTTCGSSTYGDTVSINVKVTGKPKLPAPTGTVNISDCAGNTVGPDVGLSGSSATVTTNTLTPDIKNICGIYSPDAAGSKFYFNDQSSPLAWVVNQAATTTALKSDATTNPIVTGTSVTFTATVTGVPNGATPTGNVTFNDTFNGSTTPLGTTNLGNGTAAFVTSKLQDGVHSIAATYNGDKNYKTSTSSPIQQTLQTKPVVQSLSLLKGPPGIGLVVNGKNFGNGGPTSKVEFKAADGTRTQLTLVGPGWTPQAITVQIPTTLKLGAGTIVVTALDPAGNPASSNELSFEVANPFGCP